MGKDGAVGNGIALEGAVGGHASALFGGSEILLVLI